MIEGRTQIIKLVAYTPGRKRDGLQILPVSEIAAKDEFFNIKNFTRDDVLAAHLHKLNRTAIRLAPLYALEHHARCLERLNLNIKQLHDDFTTIAPQPGRFHLPSTSAIHNRADVQLADVRRFIAE